MRLEDSRERSAFTLVEVLIVVLILGILAAVVVPKLSTNTNDASAVALMASLDAIKKRIDFQYHRRGDYPEAIEAEWFSTGVLPRHPQNSYGVPAVEVVDAPGVFDPQDKVLTRGTAGAYWYNAAEGVIRARVAEQGSKTATAEYYNRVNGVQ